MSVQAATRERVAPEEESAGIRSEENTRAYTYSLLAASLAGPPTQSFIDCLKQIPVRSPDDHRDMALAWETLRAAGHSAPSCQELDDEYHALFIGMGRGELVPFGSWYQTGFLMDQPLSALRDDLKKLGFTRQENVKEPEDHIAALCETMAMIVADEAISFQAARSFFKKHLEPWAEQFFADLVGADNATFYAAIGEFGGRYIRFEKQYLDMLA